MVTFCSSNDVSSRTDRWAKYKYRLYLGIGFTCVWNFSRLYSLLVAWATKVPLSVSFTL
jgi:hypothetical protein